MTSDRKRFEAIYADGGWDGHGSGPGSTPAFTEGYRRYLQHYLDTHHPARVLDLACGDWQFSRLINWGTSHYTGIDIVPSVIAANQAAYPQHAFLCRDIFDTNWLDADLLIIKDLLHHIPAQRISWLIAHALSHHYPAILWTVDLNPDSTIANVPGSCANYFALLPIVYQFDTSVDSYRYGPKVTLLDAHG